MIQISIENLAKKYRRMVVFKNVDLVIDSKKYNFLVGQNGTGKSTFIKCLLGEVKYDGIINLSNLRISYAPERINLPDYISVINFLTLLAKIDDYNLATIREKIKYYLKNFDLEQYKKMPLCKLSQGNRQKVILIQALMMEGDIYIFDEPLTGLDENSQNVFIQELKKKKSEKKLIIISTHRLDSYKFRSKNIIHFPLQEVVNG